MFRIFFVRRNISVPFCGTFENASGPINRPPKKIFVKIVDYGAFGAQFEVKEGTGAYLPARKFNHIPMDFPYEKESMTALELQVMCDKLGSSCRRYVGCLGGKVHDEWGREVHTVYPWKKYILTAALNGGQLRLDTKWNKTRLHGARGPGSIKKSIPHPMDDL